MYPEISRYISSIFFQSTSIDRRCAPTAAPDLLLSGFSKSLEVSVLRILLMLAVPEKFWRVSYPWNSNFLWKLEPLRSHSQAVCGTSTASTINTSFIWPHHRVCIHSYATAVRKTKSSKAADVKKKKRRLHRGCTTNKVPVMILSVHGAHATRTHATDTCCPPPRSSSSPTLGASYSVMLVLCASSGSEYSSYN